MKKKTEKSLSYKWQFENIGGTPRVKITSGNDIAHLGELEPTMWTVLSCPVKGLEINEKSLSYIDLDGDGKIRVKDIVATAKWATDALKDKDLLLKELDRIKLDQFNLDNETGRTLHDSAKQILANLGKDADEIALSDTSDNAAIFAKTRFNGDGIITMASTDDADEKAVIEAAMATIGSVSDRSSEQGIDTDITEALYKALGEYDAWTKAIPAVPFGDKTDTALEAYRAIDSKVKDFFMRSRLAAFSPASMEKLDVQATRIEAISAENLAAKIEEIGSYPIARITDKPEIGIDSAINPAWSAQFKTLTGIALPEGSTTVTEEIWAEIGTKLAAYSDWKAAKAGASVEKLGIERVRNLLSQNKKNAILNLIAQDNALKAEADNIENVDRFLHIFKDFYKLLRNFITFNDFYSKKKSVKAIFQSGTLIIDQRACHLCLNVADMGKHNTMAAASGMFLVYCHCTTKMQPGTITIAAAVTVGDIRDLFVGKNAVYYDNKGVEWDAVITKIIDNPISVSQAFWSPYRRMSQTIENLISKSAADKDAKMMKNTTDKIKAVPATIPANHADTDAKPAVTPPFDIAKFAGIFAAIGMALGMIGTALASLVKGFASLTLWQILLVFVCILLAISGPAMIIAWMKLRRRNIAPLLNANGWAINAASKINIRFGATLTDIAKFPKIKMKDPYGKNRNPWTIVIIVLLVIAILLGILYWVLNTFYPVSML